MHKIYQHIPDEIEQSSAPWDSVLQEDFHVSVYHDRYPCTPGHLLFVPRHNSIDVLGDAFEDALRFGKRKVDAGEWAGFNIGMNYGSAAGQTVDWPHIHVIPRQSGDMADPVGGVRNTIPGQGNYRSDSYKDPTK